MFMFGNGSCTHVHLLQLITNDDLFCGQGWSHEQGTPSGSSADLCYLSAESKLLKLSSGVSTAKTSFKMAGLM